MSHMSKYSLLIKELLLFFNFIVKNCFTACLHGLIILSSSVNPVQIIQGEKRMRRKLMSWTTVRKGSFGPLTMSLWREQRAQRMSLMSLMKSDPNLDLSSPYLL